MESCNEVRLAGRISGEPEVRALPSGDEILVCRVVVPRDRNDMRTSRQTVDVVDCVVWSARIKRTVGAWKAGDEVQVEGAMRRRFFKLGSRTESRVEVEVSAGRRLKRSKDG